MSKVRLLFAPESVGIADRIAAALRSGGHLPVGYDDACAAALVIWSPAACGSADIIAGARAALARRVLVPVALGKAPPPQSFEHLWPMDLSGWDGAVDDPRWKFVLDEIDLAVRRGVEVEAALASPPNASTTPPPARRFDAAHADDAFEDIFEEPMTYVAGARPRPRIPVAALFAGFAFLGVASGAAFIAGQSAASRAPLEVADEKPPAPVIAFVHPKDQPTDDMLLDEPEFLSAPAPSPEPTAPEAASDDEEAVLGEGDADFPDEGVIELSAAAEQLRDGAPAGTPPPIAADAYAPATAQTSADKVPLANADEQNDPIAGLAWNATAEAESPSLGSYLRDCLDCPDMAEIEPGVLTPDVTEDDLASPVMLRKRIAVAVRETTYDEWAACVAAGACTARPDNGWGKGKRPVTNVSWSEARAYAHWLSEKTGMTYRLPTEAEWEYAARGGAPTAYSFGSTATADKANFDASKSHGGAGRGRTLPTASFAPNGFGLYDMHGNVAEWTSDCWTGELDGAVMAASGGLCAARVVKGGAWTDSDRDLRASARRGDPETERRSNLGFRVVRNLR